MRHKAFAQISIFLALGALPLPVFAAETEAKADAMAVQVGLDRAGFSPGVIDGTMGRLTRAALLGFQEAKGLEPTGTPDAETLAALGAPEEGLVTTEVSAEDAAGPFAKIPEDMAEKAKLPGLNYGSVAEALAEKYHTTPAKLRALNPGADFSAGSQIKVPAVRMSSAVPPAPSTAADKAAQSWDATLDRLSVSKAQPAAAKVVVDKSEQNVRVLDGSGKVLAQFPATLGSQHDPLPLGTWAIQGVSKLPPFHYNPDLFWDAAMKDEKALLPPGPNGPVGVVWIDLSKEHYGIHGTPEPETVSRTQSHGCIRLTNWDAAKLAQMVKSGTPAVLQE